MPLAREWGGDARCGVCGRTPEFSSRRPCRGRHPPDGTGHQGWRRAGLLQRLVRPGPQRAEPRVRNRAPRRPAPARWAARSGRGGRCPACAAAGAGLVRLTHRPRRAGGCRARGSRPTAPSAAAGRRGQPRPRPPSASGAGRPAGGARQAVVAFRVPTSAAAYPRTTARQSHAVPVSNGRGLPRPNDTAQQPAHAGLTYSAARRQSRGRSAAAPGSASLTR